jgi:hypothetical protein
MMLEFLNRDELEQVIAKQHDIIRRLHVTSEALPVRRMIERSVPEALVVTPTLDLDTKRMWSDLNERQNSADTTPFDPDGRGFLLFPGGVTIWSGFPGAGKTTVLRQLVCHLLKRGRTVFLASLEEHHNEALRNLAYTAAGNAHADTGHLEWLIHCYGENLRLWASEDAKHRAIMEVIRYVARQGCTHAIIDSLTCLDIGGGDWDAQRLLSQNLVQLARSTGVHVHLVAHPRKPMRADSTPDIADIAGSSDFGRLSDNVIFVRRGSQDESQDFNAPTAMEIVIRKQRHGTGMVGVKSMWFQRRFKQFSEKQFPDGPTRYLPDAAYDDTPPAGEWN